MKRSIHVATISGIPIKINYTWFIIFALVVFTLAKGYFPVELPGEGDLTYWIMAVAAACLLFISLLLHELSHAIVAVKNDLPMKGITLFVFGGVAHMEKEPQSPIVEFKMAIAGPACSLLISVLFFLLTNVFFYLKFPLWAVVITSYLSMINLGVAIFNLIPGFPPDGGRLLRAALWKYFNDIKKATLIATNCGKGFAYILMGFGLLNIFAASFLSGVWFIFIGLFLLEAAEVSYQQTAMKNILSGILTKEIMTKDVVAVDAELHLNDLVDKYFFRYRFTSFPVISSDALVGLITLHNVKDVPRERWGETLTKEAMVPLSSLILIGPDVEVMEALSKMAANGIGRLIVVQDHKILGFLSQRDVMRLFEVRLDLKT